MPAGAVTLTFLDGTGTARTGSWWSSDGTVTGNLSPIPHISDTVPISALALPLPLNASTSDRQDNGNASLASILTSTQTNTGYNAPIGGFSQMTVGSATTAGRGVAVVATAAGNVVMQGADGSQITVPVNVGLTLLPFGVTTIVSSGTTATATYYVLK